MKGREKLNMDEYKEIKNGWNYDASCALTSLPVSELAHFKRLIFVAHSVKITTIPKSCIFRRSKPYIIVPSYSKWCYCRSHLRSSWSAMLVLSILGN
jgi:hypothetical protein